MPKKIKKNPSMSSKVGNEIKTFFTTVNTFTRFLTLLLLIILPILGFKLGEFYQKNKDFKNIPVEYCMRARAPQIITVTITDSQKTFNVNSGDVIKVNLPSNFDWSVQSSSEDILKQTSNNEFIANKVGTAVIQGYGKPACQRGQLCSQLVINFTANINVK